MSGKPNNQWMKTMIKKHGSRKAVTEELKRIGSIGGKASGTGGFYANRELARIAGAKGGAISRRGKGKKTESK